jgi:hypothetical protein
MRALLIALVLVTVGIATARADDRPSSSTSTDYIGTAHMRDDGTLELFLVSHGSDGIIGHAYLTYRPGDAGYQETLAHVGPIKPGESKPVRPWPVGK